MGMRTLRLSIDDVVLERARRYCERHGIDLSRLLSDFLSRLPEDDDLNIETLSPTVRRLYGAASGGFDEESYHRYLLEKYGS
jgi:antitoxin component of RelBE/YafQ-DinJ toxin-antitoxin module